MAVAKAAVVFTEYDVQDPVHAFNGPMPTYGGGEFLDAWFAAADVVTHLTGLFAARGREADDLSDGAQPRPFWPKPVHCFRERSQKVEAFLDPAARLLSRVVLAAAVGGEIALLVTLQKEGGDGRRQLWLVVFHRQQKVPLSLHDLRRDLFLTPHRIDADDRALQFQHFQELRNRRDFVGLVVHGDLAQGQSLSARPGADQMQWVLTILGTVGTAQGLAVDGHEL